MSENYYVIILSYEIPYNVLDSTDPDVVKARDNLYERVKNFLPDKYEKFSAKMTLQQLKDTLNYVITYETFFRSTTGLPMEEYVEARSWKEKLHKEFEDFFSSVDCDFKQLNIKTLL